MRKFLNDDEHRLDEFLDMLYELDEMTDEEKVIEEALSRVMLTNEFLKVRNYRMAVDELKLAREAVEKAKKIWDANKLTLDQEFMVVEAMAVLQEIS